MDRLLPWLRQTGFVYVAIALLLAALAWRISWGTGAQTQPPASDEQAIHVEQEPARETVVVHVAGAVRKPGIYEVAHGARVNAAVRKAGGPTVKANLAGINLAAAVQDGQQIVVPRNEPGGLSGTTGSTGPISLSAATPEQLETLDGVGPTLAARIVEWRQANGGFSSVDQLLEVPGIGEGRLAALREKVSP
jgi:competence protein ComEA